MLAGCFSPQLSRCALACTSAGECPPDTACMADGFCHANADEPMCVGGGGDGGIATDGDLVGQDSGPPDAVAGDAGPPRFPNAVGELIITEILNEPRHAADPFDGEWFELHNTTGDTLILDGINITGEE